MPGGRARQSLRKTQREFRAFGRRLESETECPPAHKYKPARVPGLLFRRLATLLQQRRNALRETLTLFTRWSRGLRAAAATS